jgi:hypothetical protein
VGCGLSVLTVMKRLWRLRKDSTWIDARIREQPGSTAVELQFYCDGALVVAREWPSHAAAIDEAEQQRQQFQRAGWNAHW